MQIISKLARKINCEIDDAESYIKLALEYHEEDKDLADTFFELSNQEVKHADKLHAHVVDLIEEYKREHGEPPKEMLALYNYTHEIEVEKMKNVKVLQSMYK